MNIKCLKFMALSVTALCSVALEAQVVDRQLPQEWNNLVKGAAFKDRFLPMKGERTDAENIWGIASVKQRYVDNGIEDNVWSYWGGNITKGDDGRYHLFVCGWLRNSPKGHMEWSNSLVFHTISDSPSGPYKSLGAVAKGHNPELFRLDDGTYILYVIDGYYSSNDLYGEWSYKKFDWDARGRDIIEGLSNVTFAKREDGSLLAICRGGGSWISKDGVSVYNQISDKRAYPPIEGHFEDPVVWRDNVQYNMIVNDWYGRVAYYLRSKDGIDWIVEDGEAYTPGIARHSDGILEDWFKFERMKVLQDEYGRAIYSNFAVCDTLKHFDLANDPYSSKNVILPLNKGLLMTIQNSSKLDKNKKVELFIASEDDFDAANQIDFNSLHFGSHSVINYGGGSSAVKVKKDGTRGVTITFDMKDSGLTDEDFAAKVIGVKVDGSPIFGYARMPEVTFIEPIISTEIVRIKDGEFSLKVENFGQVASKGSTIELFVVDDMQKCSIAKFSVAALEPYQSTVVSRRGEFVPHKGKEYIFRVEILTDGKIARSEILRAILYK